jgi:hypothetical protein
MTKVKIFKETDAQAAEKLRGSRRSFLRYGGATLATAGLLFTGCQKMDEIMPDMPKTPQKPGAAKANLGSGDIGILNYALALEQLEAEFYNQVVMNGFYRGASGEERRVLRDLLFHEVAHRDFLRAALGESAIPVLKFDFSSVDFTDRNSVLGTAKVFENLGVAAYNGAGKLLENPDFLVVAGKIVSVEARHAAAISDLIAPMSTAFVDVVDEQGLDRAFEPSMVLQAADPFIVTEIDASNLPSA